MRGNSPWLDVARTPFDSLAALFYEFSKQHNLKTRSVRLPLILAFSQSRRAGQRYRDTEISDASRPGVQPLSVRR
jgi:hypothetical protein